MQQGTWLPIRQYFRLKEISPSHLRPLLSKISSELGICKAATQRDAQQCQEFLISVLRLEKVTKCCVKSVFRFLSLFWLDAGLFA